MNNLVLIFIVILILALTGNVFLAVLAVLVLIGLVRGEEHFSDYIRASRQPYIPTSATGVAERLVSGVDDKNTSMVRARTRDEFAMRGALLKGSHYFGENFRDELAEKEAYEWWGEDDY